MLFGPVVLNMIAANVFTNDAFPEYICLVSSPTHPFSIPGVGVVVISHLQALMCFPCDVFGQYSWLGVVVGHGS